MLERTPPRTALHTAIAHDSSTKQVNGEALYIDDLRSPDGTLEVYIAHSRQAHARLTAVDLGAVARARGVRAVLSAADIPGIDDVSCIHAGDEPVFAKDTVLYHGHPIFAVVADSVDRARAAAVKARIAYEELEPILSIAQAMQARSFVSPPRIVERGNAEAAIKVAPHRLKGRVSTGAQDHFYLETHISLAVPQEDGDLHICCSTQNPSEVQHVCARVLGLADNAITVEVRRMGGAFGGKETQANLFAVIAALGARKTGKPVKVRLDRDDDMIITGKRHEFEIDYDVGFDGSGRILGIKFVQKLRCGMSLDLSAAVADRGVFHCDNAYFLENVRVESYRCKTNNVSNTAFRGFGTARGDGIERAIPISHIT